MLAALLKILDLNSSLGCAIASYKEPNRRTQGDAETGTSFSVFRVVLGEGAVSDAKEE